MYFSPPFDVDMFLRAAEILSGSHNFLSFTTKMFLKSPDSNPIKNMSICVKKSSAYMEDYQASSCEGMEFWEVHFRSKSFLYKQVCIYMFMLAFLYKKERKTLKHI